MLSYLSQYTYRIAISNSRLLAYDGNTVTFKWTDYRQKGGQRTMTLTADEFLRRFLMHVLPQRFHRIRHFDSFTNPPPLSAALAAYC